MSDSQAIVIRQSTDLAALAELKQALLSGESPAEVVRDPGEISREIVAQLLAAESDEELERVEAQGWRELAGLPIEIQNFVWRPSGFEEGQAVFLVVRGKRLDTGEPVVLTTGSANVMAQLANMAMRGTLAGAVRQVKVAEKATANGFKPYWLETPQAIKEAQRAASVEETAVEEPAV